MEKFELGEEWDVDETLMIQVSRHNCIINIDPIKITQLPYLIS